MGYTLDSTSGNIIFPDGFSLPPPYEHARYFEYVDWVCAGNVPVVVADNPLMSAVDIEVSPCQARAALDDMGLYDVVLALMSHPDTPRPIKIKWEFTASFRRNDPTVLGMAGILGWDSELLDDLFSRASIII